MAFEIAIPTAKQHDAGFAPLGIDLPAAYLKITMVMWHFQPEQDESGAATKGEITFNLGLWASKEARGMSAAPLGNQRYVLKFPDMTKDLIAQCYAAAKEFGSFSNLSLTQAKDV
jgi:hypothetical protein